jgi:hypothetical protein
MFYRFVGDLQPRVTIIKKIVICRFCKNIFIDL